MITRSILTLVAALLVAACSSDQTRQTSAPTKTAFAIPALKVRVEGLRGAEFERVRRQVDGLRARIASDPRDADALGRLAAVFINEARVTGEHPYYYGAAISLVDRALAIAPNDYVALVTKGSILLSLHQFSEALVIGERAAKAFPTNAIVQGILVDANLELGNYAAAVAAADLMVAMRPDLKSYSRVSYLREVHGDIDGAIEAMRMAVAAGAPGSEEKAWARTTLATTLMTHGRRAEARRELELAAIERDRYPFAIAGLARLEQEAGNTDRAIALLDSATAMIPEFSFVERKAEILRAAGRTAEADSLVGVVERMLDEDEAAGHTTNMELALLYARNGIKLDVARERMLREVARRPNNREVQAAMALVAARSAARSAAE
jgi:tetratricopeptide (TPR) repeat protein